VLPPDEDGPGAVSLVRPDGQDMFGWGAREAVVRALAGAAADRRPFGAPASEAELEAALDQLPDRADRTAVEAVCFAHGWRVDAWEPEASDDGTTDVVCRVSPATT
jgi:coenzyme F420-0:L-glutamate ligase/coenzyme F420-1:gamma-L-glutamate ligase